MATTWTAGWNMPGYLPETDPETFDTLEDAVSYLRDTVERWLDQDYNTPKGPYGDEDPDYAADMLKSPDEIVTVDGAYAGGWYRDIHLWAEPTGSDR